MTQFILPRRILSSRGVTAPESLLCKKTPQIGLFEPDIARFAPESHIILDFGREVRGGIRLLAYMAPRIPVRVRLGESVSECCAEPFGPTNATNDHALRDLTVELQNYSDMTFGGSGFRFVRLDFSGEVTLKSVLAVSETLRRPALYRYRGPDPQIRKIYETAKRTVDLCAAGDYLWDGIKRDRLVWIGDMHPEMLALVTLYGRLPIIERSLDFVRDQTPLPGWMNDIPTYSLWWIIILSDYAALTGAWDYVAGQLDYLRTLLTQMSSPAVIGQDGALHFPYFVDWPTRDKPDEEAGVRAIAILACRHAISILEHFGMDTAVAEQLLTRLQKVDMTVTHAKQVAALKYFATGNLTEDDWALLTRDGAAGLSTFMSYYILKAVASFDRPAAIQMMKDYYGGMLSAGATTFWEDFDLAWLPGSCPIDRLPAPGETDLHGDFGAFCYLGHRHSLCHGWSAGVIRFMKEELEEEI